jgi:LacI family transcriptional regulator
MYGNREADWARKEHVKMAKKQRLVPALQDVARKAGVGAATVSRVINGGRNVSPSTLAAVSAAIRELGYHPNHAARSLKGAKTKTIGLVVPSVADPFFSSAAAAIEEVARKRGTLVLLATSNNDPKHEREQMSTLIQRRVDGLILVPSSMTDRSLFEQAGFPTICLDRPIKGSPIPTVLGDNYGGAKAATRHLIDHGYRRILCLGGDPQLFTSKRRFQGHKDVIEKAGLPYLAEFHVQDYESAELALRNHLSQKPRIDAVFTTKNSTTVFAYKILKGLGLSIPGDVALLGYDDFELADALDPPISVIRQPVAQLATAAAELLFQQLEDRPAEKGLITMDVELVPRKSCGCGN